MPETDNTPQADAKADDRRGTVDPSQSPTPSSPEPNDQAVKQAEETLERIKPY